MRVFKRSKRSRSRSVKAPSVFQRIKKIFDEVKKNSISDWEQLRAKVRTELT